MDTVYSRSESDGHRKNIREAEVGKAMIDVHVILGSSKVSNRLVECKARVKTADSRDSKLAKDRRAYIRVQDSPIPHLA